MKNGIQRNNSQQINNQCQLTSNGKVVSIKLKLHSLLNKS